VFYLDIKHKAKEPGVHPTLSGKKVPHSQAAWRRFRYSRYAELSAPSKLLRQPNRLIPELFPAFFLLATDFGTSDHFTDQ
jgi:hypothetical protein